ncbi:uncharacterized protein KY384_005088 [Bacidia gigantensis]|uniref:uncharacterized protein n=1 Tax=Bacidia gigantensis TaxID=2732470 RepID=UPI001D041415|nr:uncharacterized protein KY384_005088 [Bacidia gigantensis]KAG8530585.1 hypothetical protein KY384_005088 [Bacidia gigantensis]
MADNNFGGASSNNATANIYANSLQPNRRNKFPKEPTARSKDKKKVTLSTTSQHRTQTICRRLNEKKLNESWEKLAEETKEMQQRIEAIAARVDRVENNGTNAGDSSMEVTREIYRIEEPPFLTATIESTSETVDKLPVLTASIEKEDAVHRGEVTMNGSIQAQVETGDVGRDMAVA